MIAGFPDGLAGQGVQAGPASLAGLRLAEQEGWSAPEGGQPALGAADGKTGGESK